MKRMLNIGIVFLAGCLTALGGSPTAHDPQYPDRSVWPAWVEKTDFIKEQWPKGRLFVWARAGKTMRGVALSDPANWPKNAQPATEPAEVAATPHSVDLFLLGQVEFNGVVLNEILKGGIPLPDPAMRWTWKNVFFGEGNFGTEEELFARYIGPMDLKMVGIGIVAEMQRQGKLSPAE